MLYGDEVPYLIPTQQCRFSDRTGRKTVTLNFTNLNELAISEIQRLLISFFGIVLCAIILFSISYEGVFIRSNMVQLM